MRPFLGETSHLSGVAKDYNCVSRFGSLLWIFTVLNEEPTFLYNSSQIKDRIVYIRKFNLYS